MIRTRPNGLAIRPRPEPLEPRALLSADYGQWPLRGADPASTLLVKFADDPTAPAIRAALASVSGYIGKTYEDGTSLVDLGQGVDGASALAKLEAVPGVVFAEPNAEIRVQTTPNDPSYPSQWGLSQANGIDINAPAAWSTTTGSSSTIVAIVDTGLDLTHPEFAGRLWTNPADGSHGYNFVANTNNPQDDNGHGTHVAGIIGATGNNGIGVAGVNWNAQLMAIKFLSANGSGTTAAAISGIEWAVDHGAKVINASWGGTGNDFALSTAISYADSKGAVFVAAAGNNGGNNDTTPFYPAAYHLSNMLTVAAVDSGGNLAGFSNYGATTVDLAAPGVGIYSTLPGGYGTLSGTSMAAPFVTGVVSLLEGLHPGDTPEQIVALVKAGVKPLASLLGKTVTGGMVDAAGAIAAAIAATPKVQVLDGSAPITPGTGVDPIGTTVVGTPVTRTITVVNGGTAKLTLADPIAVPTGFTLSGDFGSTSLAPGASTSFTVSLTAATVGSYSGNISFATNDPTAPTFSFGVAGTVVLPVQQVSSAGPTGFSTVGHWTRQVFHPSGNSIEYVIGTGSDVATWSFNVAPGNYLVSASWMPPNPTSGLSSYGVLDGPTPIAPVGPSSGTTPWNPGASWAVLGTFNVSGNVLKVTLSDAISAFVIADAVRIAKV
jgi:subtilisin family serine protease